MSDLKRLLIEQNYARIEKAEEEITERKKFTEFLADLPLNAEVEEDHTTVNGYHWKHIEIMVNKAGEAQRIANDISIALYIKFYKSFNEFSGVHSYYGRSNHLDLSIAVEGIPPDSCEIEWVEEEITSKKRKAIIKCE